jgi:acyl-CoA synthetase (AMP-forming)/AMP-acid ligase II/acyl carrier protein
MSEVFSTLARMLETRAQLAPDRIAFTFLNDGERDAVSMTYGNLQARASAIATKLLEVSAKGKPVLVMHPPGLEFIAALFGCFHAGAMAVPTYPPMGMRSRSVSRLANIVADAHPILGLSTKTGVDRTFVAQSRDPGIDGLRLLATDTLPLECGCPCEEVGTDAVALIQYTSGSTGSPRGVVLTHENLLANLAVIHGKVIEPVPPEERVLVSWVPPYHDMGLIGGILAPIFGDVPAVLMSPQHFQQRPLRWLEAIARYRGSIAIAPNSAIDWCVRTIGPEERAGLDLSSLQVVVNGAEPVRAETLDRFAEAFAPCGFRRRTFLPSYGLAESTLLVSSGLAVEEPRMARGADGRQHVSCGTPGAGHAICIADPETGLTLPDGETGEICIAGPSVCRGYWSKPEESAQLFRGGFLRTGDLGFLDHRELFVNGRLKDLIIVRGRNVYPQDVEHAAEAAHPALALDASAAFAVDTADGEQAVVVCEVRRERRRDIDAAAVIECIRRAVAEEFDLRLHAVALLNPGSIPRTTSGKIRRHATREAFERGDLNALALEGARESAACPSTPLSTVDRVRTAIAGLRKIPAVWLNDNEPISALGVDSLMRVELLLVLEAELECSLEADTVDSEVTIPEIARRIERQRARAGASMRSAVSTAAPGLSVPLAPRQRWFLRPGIEDIVGLSTVVYLRTPAGMSAEILERGLQLIELQQDALRLRFRRVDGDWRQEYVEAGSAVRFSRVDLGAATPEEIKHERVRLEKDLPAELNPEHGPLVRGVWYDRGRESPGLLFLCIHHLVCDGLSVAIFVATLERFCRILLRGEEPQISPVQPSFGTWATALDSLAQTPEVSAQSTFWQQVCETGNSPLPEEKPKWESTQARSLSPKQQIRLDARYPSAPEQHDLLLAAFWCAWEEETGERELFVELENHGRNSLADCLPMRTMGWFVSRFPARLYSSEKTSEMERLEHVRKYLRATPMEGAGYGMLAYLHRDAALSTQIAQLTRPKVVFLYYRHLHDVQLDNRLFTVLREYSLNNCLEETSYPVRLILQVNQRSGLASWRVLYDANIHSGERALALSNRIASYLEHVVR